MSSTTSTASLPSAAAGASQEAQEAVFATDPRIHFSTVTKRWGFEDDDGNEFEYDAAKAAWLPVIDDELLKKQQAAYSVAGVDEEAPAAPVLARQNKKRKEPEDYTSATPAEAGPSAKKGKSSDKKERKSKNTAVYITGLPIDTDVDELIARFTKCGVIEEDDEGEPKVKMYAKDDGSFSGDALIVFFKEESVALAVAMLDDAELRIGDNRTRMNVSLAQFNHKETHSRQDGESKPRKVIDKKKATKRIGRMQKKLEEWDDEDNFGPSPETVDVNPPPKTGRVVVLKHMFTLEALKEDATLLLDLKEDVREECSQLGEVTNVVLYDLEPEGIMTVKFRDPLSAQACILKMQGRYFDGKRVEASIYSGRQRFKRSGAHGDFESDDNITEKMRLDDFAKWLTEGD